MRGRGLLGAIVYKSSTDTAVVYLCHDGRYLTPVVINSVGWGSHEMKRIKFGDERDSVDSNVGPFQWFGVAVDSAVNIESQVKSQFRSLDFLQ